MQNGKFLKSVVFYSLLTLKLRVFFNYLTYRVQICSPGFKRSR